MGTIYLPARCEIVSVHPRHNSRESIIVSSWPSTRLVVPCAGRFLTPHFCSRAGRARFRPGDEPARRDSALATCLRVAIPPWRRACASRFRPGDVPARRDSAPGTCLRVASHEGPSRSTRACGSAAPAAAQRQRRVRLSSWDSSAGARRAGAPRPMHAQRTQRKPYTHARWTVRGRLTHSRPR
jgi:hypothetical protein